MLQLLFNDLISEEHIRFWCGSRNFFSSQHCQIFFQYFGHRQRYAKKKKKKTAFLPCTVRGGKCKNGNVGLSTTLIQTDIYLSNDCHGLSYRPSQSPKNEAIGLWWSAWVAFSEIRWTRILIQYCGSVSIDYTHFNVSTLLCWGVTEMLQGPIWSKSKM